MEQPATIALDGFVPGSGLVLQGLFVPGQSLSASGAVIAPPHPLYGGSLESPVLGEVADRCDAAGIASLRFNWRGVGASAGERSGDDAVADADYAAALAFLEESVTGPILACGYSFGAATAVRTAGRSPRIESLLLVAPPPSLLDVGGLQAFAGDIFIAVGEQDSLAEPSALETIAKTLERAHFTTIPETDHFFMSGLAALGREVERWLQSPVRLGAAPA